MYRAIFIALCSLAGAPAFADAGHVDWHGWSFDWQISEEAEDGQGLELRNVSFNGLRILGKASLPVIRVQYDYFCNFAPFADQWGVEDLENNPECNDLICVRSFTSGGMDWVEVSIRPKVGSYRLIQSWSLSRTGIIEATAASSGIECYVNHRHHPYWRFNFDINGAAGDEVWVFEDPIVQTVGDKHFVKPAPVPYKYKTEVEDLRNMDANRRWFIRDAKTGLGAWVIPRHTGQGDGDADPFSKQDVAVRAYRPSEDQLWEDADDNDLPPGRNGNVDGQNIVFWYVAHLYHAAAAEAGDEFHVAGPRILVHTPPVVSILQPANGASFPGGAFSETKFVAVASNLVGGDKCCTLVWTSTDPADKGAGNIPGEMGRGPSIAFTFNHPGIRHITATATDITGLAASASITVNIGTAPATISILQPAAGAAMYRGFPATFEASSVDFNEPTLAIPCQSLHWTSDKASDPPFPFDGCSKDVSFATVGPRTITISGKDSKGVSASAKLAVKVIDQNTSGIPLVHIQNPGEDFLVEPAAALDLIGQVTDPSGKNPLTYKWTIKEGGADVTLGTSVNLKWTPSKNVGFHCGGAPVRLCLYGTNAANATGSACVNIVVNYGPC